MPPSHVPGAAQSLLTRLRAALSTRRRQTRLGPWLHAVLYATLVAGPWSPTLLAPPSLTPTPADLAALYTALAPLLATLTPEQSGALELFDLSTQSLNAAAGEAGTDRPTFQNRLQRARLRLVHHLGALTAAESPATADV